MGTTTTNLNLFKPELTDPADITRLNPNWDKLDKEIQAIKYGSSGSVKGSGVTTFQMTIGTNWYENEDTGVKTQDVIIEGAEITADNGATIDHVYTGDGTDESYKTFVEEENQYLTYITNGYAETITNGIRFHIFGDANTVSIPIIVEVV